MVGVLYSICSEFRAGGYSCPVPKALVWKYIGIRRAMVPFGIGMRRSVHAASVPKQVARFTHCRLFSSAKPVKLSDAEITEKLGSLHSSWSHSSEAAAERNILSRSFEFRDFHESFAFMTQVG